MMKRFSRRLLAFVLVLILAVPAFAVPASAYNLKSQTLTFDAGDITISGTKTQKAYYGDFIVNDSDSLKSLTISGGGYNANQTKENNNVITVTLNLPANTIVEFDYSETISGTLSKHTIAYPTAVEIEAGHYTIPAGESGKNVRLSYTAEKGALIEAKLENITLREEKIYNVTVNGTKGGTVTAGDTVLTDGDIFNQDISDAAGLTLLPEPDDDYVFAGYKIVRDGTESDTYIGSTAWSRKNLRYEYSLYPETNTEITPVFVYAGDPEEPTLLVGSDEGDYYPASSLDKAIELATEMGLPYIIPITDLSVSEEYTIPSGITLLIPNGDARTFYTTTTDQLFVSATESNAIHTASTPYAYVRMELKNGAALTFEDGAMLSISGNLYSPAAGESAKITGGYGQLIVDEGARVTFEKGSEFNAWGFATGEGMIECLDGSTVREYFQIGDFSGGTNTVALALDINKTGATLAFPFSQYYVQNVECKMKVFAGAEEYVYASFYAGSIPAVFPLLFIGTAENEALFTLTSGHALKYYDYEQDKLICRIEGDEDDPAIAEINSISLVFEAMGASIEINSIDFQLPISNIGVEVGSGSEVTVNQSLQLLPDSSVTVDQDATLILYNNVYLVDESDWVGQNHVYNKVNLRPLVFSATRLDLYGDGASPRQPKGEMKSAVLDNNGTVVIDGGALGTTAGGAVITSSQGTGTFVNYVPGDADDIILVDFTTMGKESIVTNEVDEPFPAVDDDGTTYYYNGNDTWSDTPQATYAVRHSLSLEGQIHINFYWQLPEGADPADYTYAFSFMGETTEQLPLPTTPDDSGYGYKTSIAIDAPEMTCDVNATLYKSGTAVKTDSFKAADYAKAYAYTDYATALENDTPYLIGKINGSTDWSKADPRYKLVVNTAAEGTEYMIQNMPLTKGDEIKVVIYKGDSNYWWYPNGDNNNYQISANGVYNIYFREADYQQDGWWYDHIRVETVSTDKDTYQAALLPTLIQATLNYGAKAQARFGVNSGDLANSDAYLTDAGVFGEVTQDMVNAKLGDSAARDVRGELDQLHDYGLELYGSSLVLNSNTKIKLYYGVENLDKFNSFKGSFTFGGTAVTPVYVSSDVVCFTLDGIAAVDLDKRFELANTAGSASVSYAALDYVSLSIDEHKGSNEAMYNLTQALYWYNVYADAYFG